MSNIKLDGGTFDAEKLRRALAVHDREAGLYPCWPVKISDIRNVMERDGTIQANSMASVITITKSGVITTHGYRRHYHMMNASVPMQGFLMECLQAVVNGDFRPPLCNEHERLYVQYGNKLRKGGKINE